MQRKTDMSDVMGRVVFWLSDWQNVKEDVYEQAVINMRGDGYSLRKMGDVVLNLIGGSGEDFPVPDVPDRPEMYVLTNKRAFWRRCREVIYVLVIVLRMVIGTLAGAFLWFLFRTWHDGKSE